MTETCDVLIVGGGVMGSSIASFLTSDPGFAGRVLVIERDPTYEFCSTTRSWGGVRVQFSTPENIRMARFNIDFFKHADETLAADGEAPMLGFREQGYLFLAGAATADTMREVNRRQRAEGANVDLLGPAELRDRFPWLNTDGLALGSYGAVDEGWLDPNSLLQAFRRKARAQGAAYRTATVARLRREGNRIAGVELDDGTAITGGTIVLSAGGRSGALAATAGIALPVSPKKRMTYVFACREDLSHMPLTIDPSGVGTRPESGQHLGIVSPPPDRDPDSDDFELEYDTFEETVWPTLAHRVPAFEAIKLIRAWAGHYDHNTFDHNAILGPHPEVAGILFCTGFSGHGIQQSPSAGRATAELIVHGGYRSLDLSAFDYARIPDNRPIVEDAVV
jgi:FAD-dependent oxidoreductase domain-containing protein 1